MRDFEKKSKSGREVVVEASRPAPGCSAFERLPCLPPLCQDHAARALASGSARMETNKRERTKERQMPRLRRKEREIKPRGGREQGEKIKRMKGKRNTKIGKGEIL